MRFLISQEMVVPVVFKPGLNPSSKTVAGKSHTIAKSKPDQMSFVSLAELDKSAVSANYGGEKFQLFIAWMALRGFTVGENSVLGFGFKAKFEIG